MDTVTQFVLGAAIGQQILGKQVGRKALLVGGLCGMLPDVDVFFSYTNPVEALVQHRSWTHSLFILTLLTPILAEAASRGFQAGAQERKQWYLLVWLALITHPLLDAFTTYGTQIFWPFSTKPVAWSTIFIIDPLYTLPLLIAVGFGFLRRGSPDLKVRINKIALILSSTYLLWTLVAQQIALRAVLPEIRRQGLSEANCMAIPTPLNSWLWRFVLIDQDSYYNIYYSLWDQQNRPPRLYQHQHESMLFEELKDNSAVQKLRWFSQGYSKVEEQEGFVVVTDLRLGMEPFYPFAYRIAKRKGAQIIPIDPVLIPRSYSPSILLKIAKRIFSQDVVMEEKAP